MSDLSTHASMLSRLRDHGDHESWSAFDERYRDLILRYCRRKGLQPNDAEDVRQMVMLNLAKQLRTFQYDVKRGRFRHYLGRSVANAIHRLFRSPNAHLAGLETAVENELKADPDARLDEMWEEEWMAAHYRRALQAVRKSSEPQSVEAFEMLLAGESLDEVAQKLGMQREAVQKVKQRMRDRLKDLVAKQVHEEEDLGPV